MSNPQKVGQVGQSHSYPSVPTYIQVGQGGTRWDTHRGGILVECRGCGIMLSDRDPNACHRCRMATLQASPEVERSILARLAYTSPPPGPLQ